MPEHVPLYREMTVTAALDFVAHAKGYGSTQRRKFVDSAIEETGLGQVRKRLIGHLSKGYRQRVGLAQAIIGEPKVLILDEPTVGLDPRQIAEVRALIRNMAGRRTVILSTHILPEVQMTCSRVAIINEGRIAASGTPEKLTTQMRAGSLTTVRVAAPPTDLMAALRAVPGVEGIELRQDPHRPRSAEESHTTTVADYDISGTSFAPDLDATLAETIVRRGWRLLELRNVGLSLEDIFLKVIAGDYAAPELNDEQGRAAEGGREK
jgi:ABC-2 type transport system ATP-binding protein